VLEGPYNDSDVLLRNLSKKTGSEELQESTRQNAWISAPGELFPPREGRKEYFALGENYRKGLGAGYSKKEESGPARKGLDSASVRGGKKLIEVWREAGEKLGPGTELFQKKLVKQGSMRGY